MERNGAFGRLAVCAAALAVAACASHPFGPAAVTPARLGYNESIVRSADEQMLLNIVRLRYRDNPLFIDVTSVVAQYGRNVSANAGISLVDPGGLSDGGAGVSGSMSENPVITLSPIRGEEFSRRLLAPIAASEIVALAFSGWSIERLMLCCVQEIHGVRNAMSASGPTPDLAPEFEDFHRAAALMRKLQNAGALSISLDEQGVILDLETAAPVLEAEELTLFRDALGLSAETQRIRLVPPTNGIEALDEGIETAQVPYLGRSLLGVLYFLSQAVEVPAEHETKGWVTVTRDGDGRFEWSRVLGKLLRVRSSHEMPVEAAVRVRYRDTWFWVADDDLDAKTTLSLLNLLFTLKAGDSRGPTPLLAISN